MMDIHKIRRDGGTQSRAAINEATVAEYADAMSNPETVFPPITVYFDGKDYWLADGFHRLAAWDRIGRTDIPAEIRQGDRRRAILHSVAANSAHGLRRTNEDKRRAVLTLLEDEEWSAWSDREIARRCAVSHEFVRRLRGGVSVNDRQIEPVRTVERGGTVYQQNTANIGAGSKTEQEGITPAPQENKGEAPESAPEEITPSKPDQEPQPDPHAAFRKGLSGLTREGLEDEVIGLRSTLADERAKRRAAEAKAEDLKAKIAVFEADHDMGAKLGRALEEIRKVNGRMKEVQVQLARETRRANAMQKARDDLQARLENQMIPLN